jgi:CRP-like cAMP-binding protein
MSVKASIIMEKYTGLHFDQSLNQLLDEYCTFVTFQKNTIVLLQGDRATNLYFIISGLVRGYYIDEEGNDVTKSFAAENDFFSTKGYITNSPSLFNVECLEDCKCIKIPYVALIKIMENNENIFKIFNQYIITAMENLEIRTRNLVMKNAEERYRIFLEEYPELEQRINQKYIASYIGIRTGSLSRIKKNIKSKN